MNANRSVVVETMKQASAESWRKWRQHVAAGTAHTTEALEAFDAANLAGAAWLGEVAARAQAGSQEPAARAA